MRWSNLRNMVWSPVEFTLVADFDAGDIQRVLSQDGYLRKLAKRVQIDVPSKRDGAIIALVALGNTGDTQGTASWRRFRWSATKGHDVSEEGCDGGHQERKNGPCPRRSAQPKIDCSFCCIYARASRQDR